MANVVFTGINEAGDIGSTTFSSCGGPASGEEPDVAGCAGQLVREAVVVDRQVV